jgi:hypothetical protein
MILHNYFREVFTFNNILLVEDWSGYLFNVRQKRKGHMIKI